MIESEMDSAYERYFTHENGRQESSGLTWDRKLFRAVKDNLYPPLRDELDFPARFLPAGKKGRLLDVGCGAGEMLTKVAGLGWRAEGIERDVRAVETARSRGLEVRAGSLTDQQYDAASFDAIMINHAIEHVHDPRSLLVESRRILKNDGILLVTTPNSSSLGHRLYGANWAHLDPPRHLYVFNPGAIRRLAESAGFGNLNISTTARYAGFVFMASNAIQRCGKYEWTAVHSVGQRLYGRSCEFAEWALLKARPNLGEEILLQAR